MTRSSVKRPLRWARGLVQAALTCALSAALLCAFAAVTNAQTTEGGDQRSYGGATPEALLVHGVAGYEGGEMRQSLLDLEEVVKLRPGWILAERVLAYMEIRAGRFEEAGRTLEKLIGPELTEALETGKTTGRGAAAAVDPEDVLGLAIVRGQTGAYRESDLLYRAFADMVGETTPEAARAYRRLADMYERSGVDWGDASVERARAIATDPDVESASTLPRFPDLSQYPELEPYTREVVEAPGREQPLEEYDRLPRLAEWEETTESGEEALAPRTVPMELLVGESGLVSEAHVPEGTEVSSAQAAALARAAGRLVFEPALSSGLPAEVWILFGVDMPVAAGADSLEGGEAEAEADSLEGGETPEAEADSLESGARERGLQSGAAEDQ